MRGEKDEVSFESVFVPSSLYVTLGMYPLGACSMRLYQQFLLQGFSPLFACREPHVTSQSPAVSNARAEWRRGDSAAERVRLALVSRGPV